MKTVYGYVIRTCCDDAERTKKILKCVHDAGLNARVERNNEVVLRLGVTKNDVADRLGAPADARTILFVRAVSEFEQWGKAVRDAKGRVSLFAWGNTPNGLGEMMIGTFIDAPENRTPFYHHKFSPPVTKTVTTSKPVDRKTAADKAPADFAIMVQMEMQAAGFAIANQVRKAEGFYVNQVGCSRLVAVEYYQPLAKDKDAPIVLVAQVRRWLFENGYIIDREYSTSTYVRC